jgi:F-type H+-transporting ATPase subunit delta
MKATATQYAKTLYELTKDKKHQEIDEIISNFLQILLKNGQMRMTEEVVRKFSEIYNAENGIMEAQITSREEISEELRNKLRNWLLNKYNAKEVVLNNRIDKSIKGGVIVRVGDEVVDGSVDRKLVELRKELEK